MVSMRMIWLIFEDKQFLAMLTPENYSRFYEQEIYYHYVENDRSDDEDDLEIADDRMHTFYVTREQLAETAFLVEVMSEVRVRVGDRVEDEL